MRDIDDTTTPARTTSGRTSPRRRQLAYAAVSAVIELFAALVLTAVPLVLSRALYGTWVPTWWAAALAGYLSHSVFVAVCELGEIATGHLPEDDDPEDGESDAAEPGEDGSPAEHQEAP